MNKSTSYFLVPRYIRTHFRNLTHGDKWLYTCLQDLCNPTNSCTLSLRALNNETGISFGSIGEMLQRLRESGLINAEKKPRATDGREVWHITLLEITPAQLEAMEQPTPKRPKVDRDKPHPEIAKIEFQIARAQEIGAPATLIFGEWLATLEYFGWQCAYCSGPYEVIEHFVPILLGGGTTKTNCVPACTRCNNRKSSYHPLLMPSTLGMSEAIQDVKAYLDACKQAG